VAGRSFFGDQINWIALPLVAVLALDAGPGQMGLLAAVGTLPNLLFSLHAGALVDRRGRRRETMIWADWGRARRCSRPCRSRTGWTC
jgi:MFS family permease